MNLPASITSLIKTVDSFDTLAWASARINVLGEHVDYNHGFVMPASIQFKTAAVLKRNEKSEYRFFSEYQTDVSITNIQKQTGDRAWVNYLLGVMDKIIQADVSIPYFDCTIISDVPVGAGLSSSAALSCSFALALQKFLDLSFTLDELAKIAQWSEHHFAGVNCGLMDQTASLQGKSHHVIVMDCLTNNVELIPIELKSEKFLLFNSGVKHALDNSAYNNRRISCEIGLTEIQKHFPLVKNFRDVNPYMLQVLQDEEVKYRCQYVIQEIERTQLAVSLLKGKNIKALGSLMFATHQGLSKLYEVSCLETDFIVNELSQYSSVLGARMMGAGFGGCVLALVDEMRFKDAWENLKRKYQDKFALQLERYEVQIDDASGWLKNT